MIRRSDNLATYSWVKELDHELSSFGVTCLETDGVIISPSVDVAVLVDDFGVGHIGVWTSLALIWLTVSSGTAILIGWRLLWDVLCVRVVPVFVSQDTAWRVATSIGVAFVGVHSKKANISDGVDILGWTN